MNFLIPDKQTEDDIIKALEYCKEHNGMCTDDCIYRAMYSGNCASMLQKDTINLIKRQKAEIERLENKLKETKLPLLSKTLDVSFLEKDLREYADSKFQRGEPELANGILSAVCRIKALAEKVGDVDVQKSTEKNS